MSYSIFRGDDQPAPASVATKRPSFAEQKPKTKFLRMSDLTPFPRKDLHCMRLDANGEVERLSPTILAMIYYFLLMFIVVLSTISAVYVMVNGASLKQEGDSTAVLKTTLVVKWSLSFLVGLLMFAYVMRKHYYACSLNTFLPKAVYVALFAGLAVFGVLSVVLR